MEESGSEEEVYRYSLLGGEGIREGPTRAKVYNCGNLPPIDAFGGPHEIQHSDHTGSINQFATHICSARQPDKDPTDTPRNADNF